MNFAIQRVINILPLVKKSPLYNYLSEYEHLNYVVNLHSLPSSNHSVEYIEHIKFSVYDNTNIIDSCQNCVELYFLYSLHIKWKKPKLNCSMKAAKELVLYH